MVEKTLGDDRLSLSEIADILRAQGARDVYVFGSAARGFLRAGSDLDLAVSGLAPERFFVALAQVASISKHPVDLVDLDEDSPFVRHLLNEGLLERVG